MVKIRLQRTGRKNRPSYRIVAADSRTKRDGRFLEIVGFYNPLTNPDRSDSESRRARIVLKPDRLEYWLGHGAQLTETVKSLVQKAK